MADHDKTSIWKKEIGFRRKPKQAPKAVPVWPQEAAQAAPGQPEPKTSVWKKEISFGRKGKPKPVALPPVEAQPAPATAGSRPEAQTSVWKKEISFGRKPKPKVESTSAPVEAVLPAEAVLPPVSPAPESESVPVAPLPPVSPSFQPVAPDPIPSEASEPVLSLAEAEAGSVLPPVSPSAEPVPPLAPVAAQPYAPPAVPVADPVQAEVSAAAATAVAAVEPAEFSAEAVAPEPVNDPEVKPAEAPSKQSRRERREAKRSVDKASKEHGQLVGLKLGASQIAAAQVVNKGGPKIVRMARMPLERGVVVGGELREPEQLASVLKTFFRKNKLPRNCVRLGISNNRIGVRTFEISGITDPKQLANAVRFRAQEALPIPLDEAVLDYRILEDRLGEDGDRVCRVLLVVAHKELVERYVSACRKAGLKLVGIDLEAFALLRALSDPTQTPGEDAAVVCVSIGHDRSTLAVSDGRLCEFTRVLAWGGSALDAAVARVLDITPSAAVPIKHALSLGEEGEAAGLDARHADEARRAMVGELQSFARELVASLRFYQEQPKSLGIVEIMITGGAAACGGLAPELERLIGIPVRVADPLARVKAPRTLEGSDAASIASMAVAVGLGIED
jgi:type IV pilus assembly protein PilM